MKQRSNKNRQRVINLFQPGVRLTIRDIAKKLDLHYENARYHFNMASLEIPIYQVDKKHIHGRPSPIYTILDNGKSSS